LTVKVWSVAPTTLSDLSEGIREGISKFEGIVRCRWAIGQPDGRKMRIPAMAAVARDEAGPVFLGQGSRLSGICGLKIGFVWVCLGLFFSRDQVSILS
jgi:hypothetical protein